jgi:hypothetical protein
MINKSVKLWLTISQHLLVILLRLFTCCYFCLKILKLFVCVNFLQNICMREQKKAEDKSGWCTYLLSPADYFLFIFVVRCINVNFL